MKKSRSRRIISEHLNPRMGFFYTVKKSLVRKRTPFQQIELVDTDEFGKALLLDGITQVVEKNDYLYHEPMVHPAFCAHGNPREVLVIGGGDGGIIREAVKYPCIDTVRCAELDAEVIDFSKKYLHVVHGGCFDDPRVQLFIADGRSFIKQCRNSFDAIIMDMTDPFGPSRMLYTRDFFKSAKRALRDPRGVFVMHSESPICRPAAFNCIQRTLRSVFSHVRVLYVYIEMYATLWSISVASDRTDIGNIAPAVIDRRLARWGIGGLKVYNGTTNAAMQVAYPYIQETLAKKTRVITDRRPDFPDNFIAA